MFHGSGITDLNEREVLSRIELFKPPSKKLFENAKEKMLENFTFSTTHIHYSRTLHIRY
jgi:hypothetical protein